jgi:phosphate transport system substrate-binding protein
LKKIHGSSVRRVAALLIGATLVLPTAQYAPVVRAAGVQFTLAGSTQMFTLGALMANRYQNVNPNVNINPIPSTSQRGFDDACTKSIALGMSDIYIQDSQLREGLLCSDMIAIPVAVSATPVVYNLPGAYFTALNQKIGDGFTLQHPVKLTAQVLASIYMGKIRKWNDPAITSLNPGATLPAQAIRAFNSAEPGSSGFVFNQWLSLSVPAWNSAVGVAIAPSWPVGYSIGTPSSAQMVQYIKSTPYSIGFVGFDYAIGNKLQAASLENASSVFLTPSLVGLSKAIGDQLNIGMPSDFRRPFVTVPGKTAFNPADFEFFIVHRNLVQAGFEPAVRQAVKGFLEWAVASNGGQAFIQEIELQKIGNGTKTELAHGFVPVPPEIREASQHAVDSIII